MILKERTVPLRIQQLEALLRRLPKGHEKRKSIEDELARRKAGFMGEQVLDYHLSFLPQDKYRMLHDIRLINDEHAFQLDSIIVSACFSLILEVKNISGVLFVDQYSNQFIRSNPDKEQGFPNPLLQVERQRMQLERWLSKQKVTAIPIEHLVVVSNPNSILKTNPGNQKIFKRIIHVDYLVKRINELEDTYKKPIDQKDINKLCRIILKSHSPKSENILQLLSINPEELLAGVQCPQCSELMMNRVYGKWMCNRCKSKSKTAHLQAIKDYFLLVKSTITNSECRKFLQISSRHIANQLLTEMKLPYSGSKKGRTYAYSPIL